MKIRVINKSEHKLPVYSNEMAAVMDIRANMNGEIIIPRLDRDLVKDGLNLEIKTAYKAQIRPGKALAMNNEITVVNSKCTTDADYGREICNVLINLSNINFVIRGRGRICQIVIAKQKKTESVNVNGLLETDRGLEGFGHKGKE